MYRYYPENLILWKGTLYMQGHLVFRKMWRVLMTLIIVAPQIWKYACSKSMERVQSCCLLILWKFGATEGWSDCSMCLSLSYFRNVWTFNPLWGNSNYTYYVLLTLRSLHLTHKIYSQLCVSYNSHSKLWLLP